MMEKRVVKEYGQCKYCGCYDDVTLFTVDVEEQEIYICDNCLNKFESEVA